MIVDRLAKPSNAMGTAGHPFVFLANGKLADPSAPPALGAAKPPSRPGANGPSCGS